MSKEKQLFVCDAWSIISFLRGEIGGERMRELFDLGRTQTAQLWISWVNVAEVYYMTFRKALSPAPEIAALQALNIVSRLPVNIVAAGTRESLAAARFKSRYNLGIADAYAAATAQVRSATLITGDPDFATLEKNNEIPIEWLK